MHPHTGIRYGGIYPYGEIILRKHLFFGAFFPFLKETLKFPYSKLKKYGVL